MKDRFEYMITSIELNSEKARQAKADYLRDQDDFKPPESISLTTPEQKQKIVSVLETVESTHPELWWQILREMTLTSNNNNYNGYHRDSLDITRLCGWVEANIDIQSRIIEAAKSYLSSEKVDIQIYKNNSLSDAQFAVSQAFYLLSQQDLAFVLTIPSEV